MFFVKIKFSKVIYKNDWINRLKKLYMYLRINSISNSFLEHFLVDSAFILPPIGLNFRNKVHFLFIGRESSHLRNINYFDFKKIFLTHLTQGLALSIPFQIVFWLICLVKTFFIIFAGICRERSFWVIPVISTAFLSFIGPHSQHSSKTATTRIRTRVPLVTGQCANHCAIRWPGISGRLNLIVFTRLIFAFNSLDLDNSKSP